jgi:hypothetical protein
VELGRNTGTLIVLPSIPGGMPNLIKQKEKML